MSSDKIDFILYADDTTLNATVESFCETAADIQLSIRDEIQKICKSLNLNKCLKLSVLVIKSTHICKILNECCKIKVRAFPHAPENNSIVTFFSHWISY